MCGTCASERLRSSFCEVQFQEGSDMRSILRQRHSDYGITTKKGSWKDAERSGEVCKQGTSDRGQGIGLVVFNCEQLCQLGNGKDFVNFRTDICQDQLGIVRFDAFVEADKFAEGRTG